MNALYFVETTSPRIRGAWFKELDRDTNSRAAVLDLIRTGEVTPVKVLEVDEDAGTVRNVISDDDFAAAIAARSEDYRTPFAGQNRIDWENDRRRALEMVS